LGSRKELLNDFLIKDSFSTSSDEIFGWHRGVLFLSNNLDKVVGTNTVMYATKTGLIWTSDLLESLYKNYNKYFAFVIDS
jgi:hypothetical protein